MLSKEQVLEELKNVKYPGFNRDIISFGIVQDVQINGPHVNLTLDIRTSDQKVIDEIKNNIARTLQSASSDVTVGIQVTSGEKKETPVPKPDASYLPKVKYKIAVASGKGGVGKSTVAVNLAVALAKLGYKTGLLDSDIYGPSIPMMLGIDAKPEFDGEKLRPIEKYGIKIMSLGFLVNNDEAVIWRGPLVMRAIQQLMKDVNWGELDVIVFDMPPGTGDAQLTLSQSIQLDGTLIVTTPQNVALLDAVKGVQMFRKVNVPILGIVENMSYFVCPHCNKRSDIFSHGGAHKKSEKLDVKILGEIPLQESIRQGGDSGRPVVFDQPEQEYSEIFLKIGKEIMQDLSAG